MTWGCGILLILWLSVSRIILWPFESTSLFQRHKKKTLVCVDLPLKKTNEKEMHPPFIIETLAASSLGFT